MRQINAWAYKFRSAAQNQSKQPVMHWAPHCHLVMGPQEAKGCGTTVIPGTTGALGLKLVPARHEGAISRKNCEAASGEGMAAFSLLHLL